MRATEQLGRYRLLDLVTQDAGAGGRPDVYLWHGYDEILDRPVAIRVLSAEDPRCAAVLGAAQAAARVDDRRLLRVLDILNLAATPTDPARIAVVSEWASGRNLERTMQSRAGTPFESTEALSIVAEVARATAAAQARDVSHGWLRPASIFITDAGEVRVRGLAVDAALFGSAGSSADHGSADGKQRDVDALGCLVYLLTTGYWPGSGSIAVADAPRANGVVLPPSQVRAAVPRAIDDIVARSVQSAARQRGVARVADAAGFTTMIGASLDHLAPVAVSRSAAAVPSRVSATGRSVLLGRGLAVAGAVLVAMVVGWIGWLLVASGPSATTSLAGRGEDILTSSARPIDDRSLTGIEQVFPVVRYRSYDPFGDDDNNGKPDKRNGLENQESAATVNDDDPETAWVTDEYTTPSLDGKDGVGLVLDLGQPRDVQQVALGLVGRGSNIEVRVADRILQDPGLWTPLATALGATEQIEVRAPRPVTGRYVLIWFTRLPPSETLGSGVFQGGVRTVVVSG